MMYASLSASAARPSATNAPSLFQIVIVAVTDHLVHKLRGQEICSSLSLHGAKFDHIHTHNCRTATNLMKQIKQLIPMQPTGFRCSHGWHLTRIERVEVN